MSLALRPISFLILALCFLSFSSSSYARPEYAVRQKTNCSSCHVNVTGGGPRTIAGKAFGSRGLGFAKTSSHDWFYGDFRGMYYLPEGKAQQASGFVMMKATASLNVTISEDEKGNKMQAVATHNFAEGTFAAK